MKKSKIILSILVVIVCFVSVFSAQVSASDVGFQPTDGVIVSAEDSYCGCCHEHNHTGFFGKISCLFCKIITFFKNLFGTAEENPEHKYALITNRAATCTSEGRVTYKCLVCDKTESKTFAKLEHTPMIIPAKDATCTTAGLTQGSKCSVCYRVLTSQSRVPARGHSYDEGVTITAPDCVKSGVCIYTCTVCGAEKTETIPANGHALVQAEAKAASCEAIGWNAYEYCTSCDYTTYVEISATGHDYAGVVTTAPTCTEQGEKTYTCKNDANHTYTEAVVANGHTLTQVNAKLATCEAIGWNAYEYCSVCDYTTYVEIPELGHAYEGVVTTVPTCTEQGEKTYTCKNDANHTYTEAVAANGHTLTQVNAKPATCEAIGWNAYEYCSVCDYTTYVEIPELGHAYEGVITTAPTCTEMGEEVFTCSKCGDVCTEQIVALGHAEVAHEAQAATCTAIGWNAYVTCSRCTYTSYAEIPALGHACANTPTITNYPNKGTNAGKIMISYPCIRCTYSESSLSSDYDAIIKNADGTVLYNTVDEAIAASVSGDTVVVVKDSVLAADATVPAGVMLLIPCDDVMTAYMENGYNPNLSGKVGSAALYRTLTVPAGVTLTVEGTVLVNAVTGREEGGSVAGYGNSGYYGQIALAGDIIVNDGGVFDCSGYVTDNGGQATLKSGGIMYETFDVQKWRGGSFAANYTLLITRDINRFYPIYESRMNNMQATLIVEYGAQLVATVKMYAEKKWNYARNPQIGDNQNSSCNAIIRLNDGAYVIREVDTVRKRDTYNFYGDITFKNSSMYVNYNGISYNLSTDTADFYLYDGDMTLNFYAGTYSITESFAFLPGGEVHIYEDANVVCSSAAGFAMFDSHFYDFDSLSMSAPYQYTTGRPNASLTIYEGGMLTATASKAELVGDVYVMPGAVLNLGSSASVSKTFKVPNDDAFTILTDAGTSGNYDLILNRKDVTD